MNRQEYIERLINDRVGNGTPNENKALNKYIEDTKSKYEIGQKINVTTSPLTAVGGSRKGAELRHLKGRVCQITDSYIVVQFQNYRESFQWHQIYEMQKKGA